MSKKKNNRIAKSTGEKIFDVFNYLLLGAIAIITLYPFWYALVLSLNEGRDSSKGGIWLIPRKFTLDNYKYLLMNKNLLNAYGVTISRTVLGSLITLLVVGFAAYALSKKNLWGRSALLTFFMIPMFIGGNLISTFVIFAKIGLVNNFLVYILPSSFSFFYMIIFRTFIYGLPPSLEESAKIDGASYYTIVLRIIIPLCKPVVATILLFAGVAQWLDFTTNLYFVYDSKLTVLQYLLYQVVRANRMTALTDQAMAGSAALQRINTSAMTSEAVKMTTLMVVTLPIICVYPFLQKYFVQGMMVGAVKE